MFICKECGREYNSLNSLSRHIGTHMTQVEYFDKYLRTSDQEGKCIICGKPTKFRNFKYSNCCSQSCRNTWINQNRSEEKRIAISKKISNSRKTEQSIEKTKKTNLERYGYEYVTQNKEVQEKRRQTCQEKYGTDCSFQSEEVKEKIQQSIKNNFGEEGLKSEKVQNKKKQTCLERYGVDNPSKSEEVKQKIKQKTLDNYGVEYSWKAPEVINKIKQTKINKLKQFCIINDCTPLKNIIEKYGTGFMQYKVVTPIKYSKSTYCIKNTDIPIIQKYYDKMKNYHSSNQQDELLNYIKSIYLGNIEVNTKKVLGNLELDIYIPDKNLAIEFNGNYWHSSLCKPKEYHYNKSMLCKDKNIRLIHIFEYEWNKYPEICKSIISSALGIYNQKIYARHCEIKEVSLSDARLFLLANHIQGNIPSSYRLGLYYNNELVQLIAIGKSRFKKNEYELLRMCTKLNTQIIGGFSKLMKHQPYYNIISYIDFSKFNGNGYFKCGFEFMYHTKPNYIWWNRHQTIYKRYETQKHKLSKLLNDSYDSTKTEYENMINAGYTQIYDCGNIKVQYNKK